MEKRTGIIIGAGLAGLGAAHVSRFPVFEKLERAGGTADSVDRDGFVFDLGIHVLHSNDPTFLGMLRELDVPLATNRRSAWIHSHGTDFSYPFQVNTSRLPLGIRARCLFGYLFRKGGSGYDNYEEWLLGNFGAGFARTFLVPYSEKFWRHPLSDMTFEWTEQRIPKPRWTEVLRGAILDRQGSHGPNAVFRYPSERGAGFRAIAAALAASVPELRVGMELTGVDARNRVAEFNHGRHMVSYDRMIASAPLPDLVRMIKGAPPDVLEAARGLRCNSIAIVNLGVERPSVSDRHWIHFPGKDISFFRIAFQSNFTPGLAPVGKCSIQAEVSYDASAPPTARDLVARVKSDLVRVGVLGCSDRVCLEDVVYRRYGYVVYTRDRAALVGRIHRYLRENGIVPCGRYGCWEYQWSDDAVRSGRRAAEEATARPDVAPEPEATASARSS